MHWNLCIYWNIPFYKTEQLQVLRLTDHIFPQHPFCEQAQESAIVPMYVVSKHLFQKFTWKKGEMRGAMENNLIAYQSYFKLQDWRATHFP